MNDGRKVKADVGADADNAIVVLILDMRSSSDNNTAPDASVLL